MNLLLNTLFFSILLPVLANFSFLNGMHLLKNPTPFKRSKLENYTLETTAIAQAKAEYNAVLDKALQEISEDGSTILHTAVAQGSLALCGDLLSRGADPLVQNKKGQSALHVAVEYNNHVIVEQLKAGMPQAARKERIVAALYGLHRLRVPKDVRHKIFSYLPELIIASPSFCRVLISSEIITLTQLSIAYAEPLLALLNLKDSSGTTAYLLAKNRNHGFFDAAIERKDLQAAHRILKDNNYRPHQISIEQAIRHDNLEDFVFWLMAPRHEEILAANSICAFRTTSALGNTRLMAILIDLGVPLTTSALGNTRLMAILIDLGVPLDTEDCTGWTALNFAVWHNRQDAICLLLGHGAPENELNLHGRTPLYYLMPLFKSSNYPFEEGRSLATTFMCQCQWNKRPPLLHAPNEEYLQALAQPSVFFCNIDETGSKARYLAALLTFRRICPLLPRVLRLKILSHLPEDVYSENALNALYSQIEQNAHALKQVVEICPFAWFMEISRKKQLSALQPEYIQFLAKLVPLIVSYRLRRSHELLVHLPEPQKAFISNCITLLKGDNRGMIEQAVLSELYYPK